MDWLNLYREVWSIDFEFSQPPGERPKVACLVAREFKTKRIVRVSQSQLMEMDCPPFDVGKDNLFVAYFSCAEWNCFLALGWQLPQRILDLWVEFKAEWNGASPPAGYGLLGCLSAHGLDSISAVEKTEMRELAMRGGPYTSTEMVALLDYCQTDVEALDKLLPIMAPKIDFPRALLRGRYMGAVARMESNGVPIDVATLGQFRDSWDSIRSGLITEVDQHYEVFDGQTFKQDRFEEYLIRHNIPWPLLPSGKLALDDDTFRSQSKSFPQVAPLRELRHSLSELKLEKLEVGDDGRNRTMIRPFASRSSRNQPSNNKFIFGPSVWIRGLIKPEFGRAIAYIDWSQQELGIAAALSCDPALARAYRSGDPYLEFAKMAGAVPSDATKQSHPQQRAAFKVCMLAVQYGMTEMGLAVKLGESIAFARNLLRQHRETFPQFWTWSQSQVDCAMLTGSISTVFGWPIHTVGGDNPRSLANFGCQANGAEMMRLAACLLTEAGIQVCAPVHDAFLVEGNVDEIDTAVELTQSLMGQAAEIVLGGFGLDSDAEIIRWPDRYSDERGQQMWATVTGLLERENSPQTWTPADQCGKVQVHICPTSGPYMSNHKVRS